MQTVAAAIADPVRRDILSALAERPMVAGEIAGRFPISRPAISRHLRLLRESGLVVQQADGRHRRYVLDPAPLASLSAWIEGVGRSPRFLEHRLDALELEVRRTTRDRRTARQEDVA